LLQDDGEWRLCLTEVSQIQTSASLRQLFASMLLFCQISTPEALWLEFQDDICDNLSIRIPNPTADHVHDYGLFLLNGILAESGYSLENFPKMPLSYRNWLHLNGNYSITEQLNYDSHSESQLYQQLMENVQTVPEQLQYMLMSKLSMLLLKVPVGCSFSVDPEGQERCTCTKLFPITFDQQEQLYCALHLAASLHFFFPVGAQHT
jgi:hypothetical protein